MDKPAYRRGDCFGTGGAQPTTDVGERRRSRVTKRLSAEPLRRAGEPKPLHGDGWCGDGFNHVSWVGDLDLAGLGLLSDGDGESKHTVLIVGSDVIAVQALAEEQLTAELAVGPLGDLDLITLAADPGPGGSHGKEILLDGEVNEPGIYAGQVEMNLELVTPTVGVHGDLAGAALVEGVPR